ncbi:YcgL domain-containing protein [Alteromonas pelagimontana]|uniref:YcgL domain-containing protein CA267_016315 n=1 Tax=Alteromonas pelagimontana TaxID=1858656 RepID=A0A6N3IVM1_9ALTE|nr:YcgL domain-containing protein [Alteromonas pelagimontana]
MLCAVYRTRRKEGMLLYVPGKDAFQDVPEILLKQFGQPELVMVVPVDKRRTLAGIDVADIKLALQEKGFYLQMPPKQEDWLAEHRVAIGLPAKPDKK